MEDKLIEDKKIVKYIKKCNQKGMEMLIDKYSPLLRGIIRKHISPVLNYEEECLSDVLFLIWENIDGFDSKESTQIHKLINIGQIPKYIDISVYKDNDASSEKPLASVRVDIE